MILVDGSNFLWRAHFAGRTLSSKGRLSGALHIGLGMLADFPKNFKPQRVIFLWDGKKSWRKKLEPSYKANRKDSTERAAVHRQIDVFRDLLQAIGVTQVTADSMEADDLIGMLTKILLARKIETTIVSSDKDLFQLLQNGVLQVRGWTGKKLDIWTRERVEFKYGVKVKDWARYLALIGDKIDNIPNACRGMGPVRAREVLNGGKGLTTEASIQYGKNLMLTTLKRDFKESGLSVDDLKVHERGDGWSRLENVLEDYELVQLRNDRRAIYQIGGWGR